MTRIVSQEFYTVSGNLKITEYFFTVPVDYSNAKSRTLTLFARTASRTTSPGTPQRLLLYLESGPGIECRPPQSYPFTQDLIEKGFTIVFIDSRGTGLSSAITPSTLGLRGDDPVQASYLHCFRADSIVRDAEAVRTALAPSTAKWSILATGYGSFVATTYLSHFPSSLDAVYSIAGLPPITHSTPDEVYARLLPRLAERNRAYYQRHPSDIARVRRILLLLRRFGENTVRLPSEGALSVQRFLQLGLTGLRTEASFDMLHALILRCTADLDQVGHLTRPTTAAVDAAIPFDARPLAFLLHEAAYVQGAGNRSNWSAARMAQQSREFDVDAKLANDDVQGEPVFFTSEQVAPWMFKPYAELRKLQGPAELVATADDWPALYDVDQLERNEVPVFALLFEDSVTVDVDSALETAGLIKGCRVQVVKRGDVIEEDGEEVVRKVFAMRDDNS